MDEYTAQEVATGFGVDQSTIWRWGNEKGLPYHVASTFRKTRLYRHDDVVRFAEQNGLTFDPPKKK